ncbi:MAG: hypothetical protein H0T76_16925 [Nannocystis sp.]|nr:hypothetical protein [Nannocystis sp.]MBA3548168.1 hypothetical protein [Nannocystis sp.]
MLLALISVPTDDLKKALSLLHRGELRCPLTPVELVRNGFQTHLDAMLGHLRTLDAAGVRAVLTGVLAERLYDAHGQLRHQGPQLLPDS